MGPIILVGSNPVFKLLSCSFIYACIYLFIINQEHMFVHIITLLSYSLRITNQKLYYRTGLGVHHGPYSVSV